VRVVSDGDGTAAENLIDQRMDTRGLLSVLFGALFLYNPVSGDLLLVGAYSVLGGILPLIFGIKLGGIVRSAPQMVPNAV
jgi:hypothetical protein